MVFLGLEAIDEEELNMMNKKLNMKLEYKAAFANIHRARISVLGAFIFGTDTDTEKSITGKTDYILKHPIDVIQVTTLTPLPGTQLFLEMAEDGRLLYSDFPNDWSHFDMTELTFTPARMDVQNFRDINATCSKRLLSVRTLLRKFIETIVRTGSLETTFWALSSNKVYRRAFQAQNREKHL